MIESFSRIESRVSVGNVIQGLKSVCENPLIGLGLTAVPGLMYPLAKKFSGKRTHRIIKGIGHNLPQEAPQAFAEAIVDVDGY